MDRPYSYVWKFEVADDSIAEFERHYGPEGSWAQLFRRAPGYINTLLLKDRANQGRYLTVDRWQSESAFAHFCDTFAAEYEALDRNCEGLTLAEDLLGEFSE